VNRRHLGLDIIAFHYWEAGWNPFPLPRGKKQYPPSGITGKHGRDVTKDDLADWYGQWGNIGLRMPDGVVGLDVDVYKNGGRQLPDDLPFTIRATNRTDGSGIYLYKVPPGTNFVGDLPDGLGEVIQHHHRYAVVAPSLHPSGRTYQWVDDDDYGVGIPDVDDLPQLPERWLRRLQDRSRKRTGMGFDAGVDAWLDGLRPGPMSPVVHRALRKSIQELRRCQVSGGTRHGTMVRATGRLVNLGAQRHRGVEQALDEVFVEYTQMIKGMPDRDPGSELDRAISGAVAKFGGRR
jgi:hypothetical protein